MPANVLIVEPTRTFSRLLATFCQPLSQPTARLEIHRGLATALACAEQPPPFDVITVASQLDDGDGITLIYALRALSHLTTKPILFLTSDDNPETARTALMAGATEVFQKSETVAIEQAIRTAIQEKTLPVLFTGRALVVEDTQALAALLISICAELGLAADSVASAEAGFQIFQENNYQLAVIDIILAGLHSGIDLVRNIRRLPDNRARLPILATSSYNDPARRIELLRCGADDFIAKPWVEDEIVWRIRNLLQRASWEPGGQPQTPLAMDDVQLMLRQHYRLSSREAEISSAIVRGHSDKKIAAELGISFWTVRTHINHIFSKTGAFNRANLAARVAALRDGNRPAPPISA